MGQLSSCIYESIGDSFSVLKTFSQVLLESLDFFLRKQDWFDLCVILLLSIFLRYREPPSTTPKLARFLGLIWKYSDLLVVRM